MLTAIPLIVSDTPVRAIAVDSATFDDLGSSWNGSDDLFDDSSWATSVGAPNGAGYDANNDSSLPPIQNDLSPLDQFIGVDLQDTMLFRTNTMYVRIPFEVADISVIETLTLNLRHDAGYIAYLNGAEVARGLIPDGTPPWDARGTANTNPTAILGPSTFDQIDLGAFTGLLKDGTNILAIRSANEGPFGFGRNVLIQAELIGDDGVIQIATVVDDQFEAAMGVTASLDVLANDTFSGNPVDPSRATIRITKAPDNGIVIVETPETGTITYRGDADFVGLDTFRYVVSIGDDPDSQEATVSVKVRGPNPLAENDSFDTNQAEAITAYNILANDEPGAAGDPLDPASVTLRGETSDGGNAITTAGGNRVEVNSDGTINFIPTPDFWGDDTFSYTVEDTFLLAPQSVIIVAEDSDTTVLIPTDASLADTWTGGAEPFDDSAWTSGKLGVGYATATGDPYDQFIGLELETTLQNVNGSIYIRVPFDMTVNPSAIQALTLRMRYDDAFVAYLNGEEIARANFTSTPVWNSLSNRLNGDPNAVIFQDFDVTPFIDKLNSGSNLLTFQGINTNLGSSDLLIQPQLVANLNTSGRLSNNATVNVHVNAKPNTAPDFGTLNLDNSIVISVLDNDIDPDNSPGGPNNTTGINPATVEILTAPQIGTAIANSDGTISYTTDPTRLESTSLTYRVQDYEGAWSDPQEVGLFLDDYFPIATDNFDVTTRDQHLVIDVLGRVEETPNLVTIDLLSVQIDSPPQYGSASIIDAESQDGLTNMIRFEPDLGFVGRDSLTYTVADIFGNRSEPATVTIDVYEQAVAREDLLTTPIGDSLQIEASELLANDFFQANYRPAVRIGSGDPITPTSQGGTVTVSDGQFTYTPPAGGFTGVDSFEYTLYDTTPAQPPLPLRPKADSNTALVKIISGPITIEGFVYTDENQNAQRDPGEQNIADSLITLTSPDDPSLRIETLTDSNGFYRFASTTEALLTAATYTITQTQPSMFLDFLPNPVNAHADMVFEWGDDASNRGYFNFREWLVSPPFVTTLADRNASFADLQLPLNLQDGSLVVPYDAGWDGPFVAEASYNDADGSVNIKLYDTQGNLLITDPSRIDWNATPDQPLVLVVSGDNTNVSVDLPNLDRLTANDTSAPGIIDVLISSSQWPAAVLDHLNENGLGDGGYSIWNQTPLPWTNLDQIKVRFSENVKVDAGDLTLTGQSIPDYIDAAQVTGFTFDSDSRTATWTLAENLNADSLQIGIGGSITDTSGIPLSNQNFNTTAGVQPGFGGFRPILSRNGATVGDDRYQFQNDLNGNGQIDLFDALAARRRSLSAASAPAAVIQIATQNAAQNTAPLSGAAVDAAVLSILVRNRRSLAPAPLRSQRAQIDVAYRLAAIDTALAQTTLAQTTTDTRPTLSASSDRLSRRAHRSHRGEDEFTP